MLCWVLSGFGTQDWGSAGGVTLWVAFATLSDSVSLLRKDDGQD